MIVATIQIWDSAAYPAALNDLIFVGIFESLEDAQQETEPKIAGYQESGLDVYSVYTRYEKGSCVSLMEV